MNNRLVNWNVAYSKLINCYSLTSFQSSHNNMEFFIIRHKKSPVYTSNISIKPTFLTKNSRRNLKVHVVFEQGFQYFRHKQIPFKVQNLVCSLISLNKKQVVWVPTLGNKYNQKIQVVQVSIHLVINMMESVLYHVLKCSCLL